MTAKEFLEQDLVKPEDDESKKYAFASSWPKGHVEAMLKFAEDFLDEWLLSK